jgi:hypothetical protein
VSLCEDVPMDGEGKENLKKNTHTQTQVR